MTDQQRLVREFLGTIRHIRGAFERVLHNAGNGKSLSFPDAHKLSEGLFLSAWTHWESFLRELLVCELSSVNTGVLCKEVKRFRTKRAPRRLAHRILGHPDAEKWIEWSDYSAVLGRAQSLIGDESTFVTADINEEDLSKLKRIRNAIAHKSDRAWDSFVKLVNGEPYSLTPRQRKGITVGRFLSAHNWDDARVLERCLEILESNAKKLVPETSKDP